MKRFLTWLILGVAAVTSTAFAVGTVNNFNIAPDTRAKYSSMVRPAPTYVNTRVLAASVSETETIPSGAKFVLFSSNCDFWAALGASASVPAADVTDGTSAELNPAAWEIGTHVTGGGTQLTIIAATACTVSLSYYK